MIKGDIMKPSMTIEVILFKVKYMYLHNISIHMHFYPNQLINKCARKKLAKIMEVRFFVR